MLQRVAIPEEFRVLLNFRWVAATVHVIRHLPAGWRLGLVRGHLGKVDIDRVSNGDFYYDVCLKIFAFTLSETV